MSLILFLLALVISQTGAAAETESELTAADFTVESALTTREGMPANGVSDVMQDSQGYIWAATYNGLVRYDGKNIKIYNSSNVDGLASNRFLSLAESGSGTIWAGLEKNRLVRISDDSARVLEISISKPLEHVTTLLTHAGKVWVGMTNGLFLYENGNFTRVPGLPANSISRLRKTSDYLYVVYGDALYRLQHDGQVDRRLIQLQEDGTARTPQYVISDFPHQLEVLSDVRIREEKDDMLALFHSGIIRMNRDSYTTLIEQSQMNNQVLHGLMKRQKSEGYFIYGGEGLSTVTGLHTAHPQVTSLSDYLTTNMMIDREGSIWTSTRGNGLRQFVWTPVYQGDKYEEFQDIPLLATLKTGRDSLWLGTNCEGLYRITPQETSKFGTGEGLENGCIWSLEQTEDGTIWAGTWGKGVFYREPGQQRFKPFRMPGLSEANVIFSIFQDEAGDIWFGSYKNGLFRYDGRDVTSCRTQAGKEVPPVRRIYEDDNGKIWIATDNGIGYVEKGEVRLPDRFDRLSTQNFRTIEQDSDGRYWFGSYGGGILVYEPQNKIWTITKNQGLFSETVSQLAFDADGGLWLGGNSGVAYIEKEQLDAFLSDSISSLRVARIGTRKGLPIRETTGGFQPSRVLDDDGRLYIPLVQGLAVIYTSRMQLNEKPPHVVVDRVTVDGKSYRSESINRFPHDARRFVFHFSGLSYINPDAVRFKYKLKGFESEWNTSGSARAVYTSLQPGRYTLYLHAANNDGYWSKKTVRLSFSVQPPFWQTSWFYLIAVFLLASVGYGVYQWRIYNYKRYNRQLRQKVKERTLELERHIEDKDKLFSILAHDLRNPFASLMGYMEMLQEEFRDQEEEKKQITGQLLHAVRNTHELLENLLQWANARQGRLKFDPEMLDIRKVVERARNEVGSQTEYKNVNIHVDISADVGQVKADRNMLTVVIRNLISNAVKFSDRGSDVHIRAKSTDSHLVISVEDYGEGIERSQLKSIFSPAKANQKKGTEGEKGVGLGLMLCKEFVEKHGGQIWAESEPGEGSTFSFSLPEGG